jgi:hypothetical protein
MQKPNLIKQKNFLPSCISTITSAFANIYLHALGAPVFFYTRARVRVKKHKHSICFIALLVTFLTVFIGLGVNSSRADATTSDYINFQARLENSSGAIVPDGNYNVEFKLYNSASGGSALWTEDYLNSASQGIAVSNGYLTANLGSITAFPNTINWDQQLWLTINIGGTGTNVGPSNTDPSAWDGEMNPRLQLTAIPYAFRAGELAAPGSNPSTLGWVSQTSTNSLLLPNESGTLCVEGDTTNCGFAPISGSSNYIQNTTSVQSGANYNISGNGTIGGNLTVDTIQTASAQPLSITANAASTWSTSAGNLTIQAAGTNTLALDTAGAGTVTIAAANATTVDIGATGTTANATSVNIGTSSTAVQTIAIGSTYSTSTLSLEGGTGSSAISISAGVGANAATAGNGGGIKIAAGNGGNGSTANGNGGNLTLSAGAAGVGTGTTGTAGSVIVDNQSNSTTAFQVQNVSGANILNVDTATTPNLLTDGDFEGDGQGNWLGSNATLSVSNAQAWQGNNSLKVQITAANGYAYYNYSFAENAPYTLSFYGLASGSNISTINIGYTYNGTSTDKCTSQSLNTTNWTRVICSFTTPNTTLTGNANIYIKDTTNSQTFYIDGVQLQTGGSVTPFNPGGGVQLNGVVESPLTLQSLSNSTTAFQVQNAAGTSNLLVADTADNTIGIAGASTTAGYNLNVAGSINASSNITVGGTAVCLVTTCASSSGSGNYIDNAITTQKANFNIQSANASYVGAVIEGASGQSADLLDLENTSGIVASVDKNGNFTTTGSESVGTTLNVTGNTTLSGTLTVSNSASIQDTSATAFQIQNTGGSSSLLTADTTSSDMSIGIDGASTSAGYALNVTGSINASSNVYVNGTAVCTVTLCAASSGSGNYIINGTATQNANFNIQSANASYVGAVIEGASGQSADLLDLENGLGNKVFTVSATGSTFIQTTTNSTTAFQVQGSSGSSATLLNADTSNMRVGVDVTYASMTIPTSLTASAATTGSGSLTDGTTYYYVVTAIDSVGGETTPSTPPASATAGSNKIIDLYWNAVSGASAYNIYRCSGSSGCTEEYLTTVLSNYSSSDPYQDTGVITPQSISPPSNNTAYVATNNSNSNLQLTIGGNGTPTGQVYVSGTIPSKSVGSVSTGSNPRGVAISGNYAYVVNSGSSSNSLQVFDISNPDDPLSVGSVTTDSDPYAVAVSGIYAYVVTNSSDAFEIYNISNPASPTLVSGGTVSLAGPGTSVYVQGRYAYVIAGSDMQVIDISNPSSPSIISTTGSPNGGTETQVFVNDGYAYITPDTSGYSENLNISNPYSPTEPDSYGFYYGGSGTGIYAQGSYIYELLSDNLEIFDASNPSNVALLDTLTLSGSPQSIVVEGRYAYVANYYNHTIQVIDVSDPANAVLLPNTMPTSGSVISLAVEGRYAYAVNYNNGSLQVFDLGGEYAQQFQAGGAEVGNLTVTSNSTFGGDVNLQGGLTVGSTTQLDGNLGVSGTANLAGGIQGDTSSNASLGSELMVSTTNFSSNWSGTNWSNTSSGATHSTGSTAADVYSGFTPAANTTYQIVYSFNGASGNGTDNIYAEIGGVSGQTIYAGSDTNETQVITTTGTGSLQFVPSTNWNGTITSVSVKVLTTSNAALQVLNSSGVSSLDVRTSTNTGNTFLGVSSGRSNTTGSYNTTLGYYALQDNTTGSYNTVIGDYALHSNTTGNYNTATGYQALQDNTTGNYNTATGYYALLDNTTGYSNTALGYYSLQDNTIGFYNTGLGVNALQDNTSGEANAALGFNVLQSNTTGVDNAALGVVALQDNTSGYDNTASGYYSLQANTTGYDNVALGYQAGYTSNGSNANSTGSNNTFVGYQAGPGTSTQLQNATAIGTNAVVSENNALVLGCISGTNSCSANTEVGIGTASPIGQLNVQSSSYQTGQVVFSNGLTGTPPTYPNSYLPSLVVQDNETTSSRPLFFGYSTGSAWAAFLDSGSCGSFSQMCLDLGNGSTAYTALENVGTTLRVGGGDDGSFSSVVVGSGSASSSPSLLIVANGNSSTDPTESDGAIYYNSVDESFRCGENGVWRSCLGGLVNSSTGASSAVSATTTKTNFTGGINNQYTMLANDCQPGVVYLIKAQGVYSNSPTASTLTFDLTDGGTSTNLVASGAIPTVASASNAGWELNAQIICDTTGSSGTAEVQGDVMVSSSTAGAGNSTNTGLMANSGTVTLNTTTTNTLAIAVTWGANTPGNTITMRQFIVQRIGP